MRYFVIYVALAYINFTMAAPVTLWQTVTAVTNSDGSFYDPYQAVETSTAVASPTSVTPNPTATTTTTAKAAGLTSLSTGSSLLSSLESFLSLIGVGSSSNVSSGTSLFSWSNFFLSLLGTSGTSSIASASTAASSTIATQASAPIASSAPILVPSASPTNIIIVPAGSGSPSSSISDGKSQSLSQTLTLTPSLSSPNGIYDAIYSSLEEIDAGFAKAILDAHNEYRALHGSGDLSWADGPYSYVKNNADNYDCSGVLTHTHGQFGENLAAGYSDGPSAVKAWYDEGDTYNYSTHNEYNHFTQVVWKGSTQLGCAYKDCRASGWGLYIVCEYNPVGNVIGQSPQNVLPLSS